MGCASSFFALLSGYKIFDQNKPKFLEAMKTIDAELRREGDKLTLIDEKIAMNTLSVKGSFLILMKDVQNKAKKSIITKQLAIGSKLKKEALRVTKRMETLSSQKELYENTKAEADELEANRRVIETCEDSGVSVELLNKLMKANNKASASIKIDNQNLDDRAQATALLENEEEESVGGITSQAESELERMIQEYTRGTKPQTSRIQASHQYRSQVLTLRGESPETEENEVDEVVEGVEQSEKKALLRPDSSTFIPGLQLTHISNLEPENDDANIVVANA
jgi:hypothetical protein